MVSRATCGRIVVFAVALLVIGLVYRRAPINFLRAESGWYLVAAHSGEETERRMQRDFFSTSYGGHYTPLGFLGEFQFSKAVGANGSVWRGRQIVALAVVAAAVFLVMRRIGTVFGLGCEQRSSLAAALASGVAFQPAMLDFVGWPFMILQLLWMGCGVLALYGVVQVCVSPHKTRWAWIAAAAAYAAMHVSGMGLVLVGAVTAVLGGLLLVANRSRSPEWMAHMRGLAIAVAVMLFFAGIHAWAMAALLPEQVNAGATAAHTPLGLVKLLLGFLLHFAVAGVLTFVPLGALQLHGRSIAFTWPFGLLLLGALAAWLGARFRTARRSPEPAVLTRFALQTFSIAAFLMLVALIAVRELESGAATVDAMARQLANYTSVPRYVIPLHLVLLGTAATLLAALAAKAQRVAAPAFAAIAVALLVAQVEFQTTTYRHLARESRISHSGVWNLILQTVRECQGAGLPVPDVPLQVLTQEFADTTLRTVEPLIRRDLELAPAASLEFVPWEQYLAGGRERYDRVPTLQLLVRKLALDRGGSS